MSLHPARAATHLFTRERTHSLSLHSVSIFPFHPLSRSLSASSHQLTGPPVQKKTHRPAGVRGRGSTSLPSSPGGVAGAWLPRRQRNSIGEAIGGRRGQEIKGAATGRRLGCQRGGGHRSQGGEELATPPRARQQAALGAAAGWWSSAAPPRARKQTQWASRRSSDRPASVDGAGSVGELVSGHPAPGEMVRPSVCGGG
jgi:hypothetical protein